MEMFLKRSYKLIIKFDVYFRNIEVVNYFLLEKSLCRRLVCTYVTSSAASRDSAAKLTTDSYQSWVAH